MATLRPQDVRADASYHLYIILSNWFNTVLIVLSMQEASHHAHRYPSSRTTSQNLRNFSFPGDEPSCQTEPARLTSLNKASVFPHTCESVTYWKYSSTTRWMRSWSNRSVMEETSSLNCCSDLNVPLRFGPSQRQPLLTSMSTSGHIRKTSLMEESTTVSDWEGGTYLLRNSGKL